MNPTKKSISRSTRAIPLMKIEEMIAVAPNSTDIAVPEISGFPAIEAWFRLTGYLFQIIFHTLIYIVEPRILE